jgi:D-glycero-D-manno-heptose 1,7-bisphosphate phosphatase
MRKNYKPAVFLDRDGTLITDAGYLNQLSQIRLFTATAKALKLLRKKGFRLFVVSNQSGVARGYFPVGMVESANRRIRSLLKGKGAEVDAFFYCPHYPSGKVKLFAKACLCRKPKPGMIRQAARRYAVDLKHSYMVGDKLDDLLLARNARLGGSVLVLTGKGRKSRKAMKGMRLKNTVVKAGILQAAKWIIQNHNFHRQDAKPFIRMKARWPRKSYG